MRVLLRVLAPLAYCGIAAGVFATDGIPLERDRLSLWILGLLLCLSLGSLTGFVRSVLLEWLPLLAALTLYDVLRGVGGGRVPIHGEFQVWLDRHVFGFGSVPTIWLQQHLWQPDRITWFDYASYAIYMSFFVVTPLTLGLIWLFDRRLFRRYARQLTLLSFGAVAVFTGWPSLPPWLASQQGLLGGTDRLVGQIGAHLHFIDPTPLWEQGLRVGNDIAAFPSLHEGMTVLFALVLWRRVHPWLRVPLALYPLVMAFALVYTAEHYVVDLVAGAALAFGVAAVEPRLTARVTAFAARRRRGGALAPAPERM